MQLAEESALEVGPQPRVGAPGVFKAVACYQVDDQLQTSAPRASVAVTLEEGAQRSESNEA